nr:retrovirus-related Pol polyprotein from transposon TNT 1-94 [Tanacetum cinerariifolium]
MEVLLAKERILKLIQAWDEKQIESWSLPELLPQLLNDSQTIDEMLKQREQAANLAVQKEQEELAEYLNSPKNSSDAITSVLPTKEPEYSLSMRDKHLSTISKTESDEVSVKNRVQIPSKYEVTSDDEIKCDVPVKDESSPVFTTFSNPLFDCSDDFTSSDDELLSNEDVPMENFKVYSNSFFDDEEINSNEIISHYFNAESDLIESLSNHDTLIDSSSKFDYLEEISGELMPPSIVNEERIKREHEEYISLMEKLLTINSFPRPLENFHSNTIIESLPSSPIPVEDGDSFREEIDIFIGTDDLLPPGIESDDYDLEWHIHFLEELLGNDFILFFENESSNFDHHDDPSFPRPLQKPPDVEFFFDFEPNSGEVISAVMNNMDELNEDKCFDPEEAQNQGDTLSRHVDSSNMHTFYQRYPSEHRWTKDHPLEQVIGNPSQSVRTRRQLESDAEMCMFALTVSRTEPKNIKEAMADSAWIESMQEELHQFDRLDVWELVNRPLCTNVINLKWLWKNKRDEENTVIRNKSRLMAKGYTQKEGVYFEESFPLVAWLEAVSEYEVTSDDESECDVPVKDESSLIFTSFSNSIFDDNDDFTFSDDESLSDDEDVSMEDFKIYSNPFFDDEEIKSDKIDTHYFNAESNFVESLSTHDTLGYPFFEELLGNDTPPIPENESSDFDHHNDLSFPRLPPEPPDVEFFFDFEPNSGEEMFRACPYHGFSELTQIDTFYNGLNEQDQDSLNVVTGGNLLSKITREALKIIENKSKVHCSRSKSNVSRVNTNSRDSASKTDDRIDKLADQISNLVEIVNKQVITPAYAKAVEKTCVICGYAHSYYDCIATDSNQPSVCVAMGTYNQVSPPNRASHKIPPLGFAPEVSFKTKPQLWVLFRVILCLTPKGEMKAVTTRSGLAYERPPIPTNSPLEKIFLGKLKTRWSGPFTITQVFPYGTVELSLPNGPNFKVNGHRVKHYFGGDIPSKVVSDLHTIYPTMIEDSRVRRLDVVDGLEGMKRGYQRLYLGEMFCLFKQKNVLEKKSCHDFLKRNFYVSFTGSERLIGDAAKNQVSMNPTNTVYDSTRLIEKPMIAVNYKGEEKTFTAEEVSSMIAVN